jgi:hypothetical protein
MWVELLEIISVLPYVIDQLLISFGTYWRTVRQYIIYSYTARESVIQLGRKYSTVFS